MFHVARISTNIGVIFGINVGNYLRTMGAYGRSIRRTSMHIQEYQACEDALAKSWNQKHIENQAQSHRIHGAGIYANIGGILMVNVTIYSSTMDPISL